MKWKLSARKAEALFEKSFFVTAGGFTIMPMIASDGGNYGHGGETARGS
jgi:hypothetical protein